MSNKERLPQNESLNNKELTSLKQEIEQKAESNKKWILDIGNEVLTEIKGTNEEDKDLREERNFELKNIGRNSFELESFGQKMVLEGNYIYDMTSGSRFEVMKIEKELFDDSNFFKQDESNKKTISAIIKTMNIINRIKSMDISRNLKYLEDEEVPGIYAKSRYNNTLILSKDSIEKLSTALGVDTINLGRNISNLINTIKKTKDLKVE